MNNPEEQRPFADTSFLTFGFGGLNAGRDFLRLEEPGNRAPVVDAKFCVGAAEMSSNSVACDKELVCNLPIVLSCRDSPQNLELAPGEPVIYGGQVPQRLTDEL